jgi:hypothetical protein
MHIVEPPKAPILAPADKYARVQRVTGAGLNKLLFGTWLAPRQPPDDRFGANLAIRLSEGE